jgi:hypothetical protein
MVWLYRETVPSSAGSKFNNSLSELGSWIIEIIKRPDTAKGFEVLPAAASGKMWRSQG